MLNGERMDQLDNLDYVLVPVGIGLLGIYHVWLILTIRRNPTRTVIGLNAESRRQWVFSIMDVSLSLSLSIHAFCMALCILVITIITQLCYFPGSAKEWSFGSSDNTQQHNGIFTSCDNSHHPLFPNKCLCSKQHFSWCQLIVIRFSFPPWNYKYIFCKYFAILVCFLLAFLCNVQCLRYYAHVSFLATLPTSKDRRESIEYVVANLNRGSFFWSLGLRAFYLSFPLFLWVFGPISMFLCCCVMSVLLYFLDTTSSFTRILHSHSVNVETKPSDVESVCQPS
ncbi:hypothetical protein C3L33_02876, partial [Rhododendron williamsianum]